jgi:hypothetical protein
LGEIDQCAVEKLSCGADAFDAAAPLSPFSNPATLAKQESHHKDASRGDRNVKRCGIGLFDTRDQRAIDRASTQTGTTPGLGNRAGG